MSENYWQRRLTRRRVIKGAATTGAGAAALALIACGGSGGKKSQPESQANSDLNAKPQDTSAQAKRGGIYQTFNAGDETTFDPFTTSRGAGQGGFEVPGYQKLLREKESAGGTKTQVFEGDAAESYELTDG